MKTVPAAPVRAVIERWYENHRDLRELEGPGSILLSNLAKVVQETGLSKAIILAVLSGRRKSVSWETADRIVLGLLGPDGWHVEPELSAIYEGAAA